MKRFKFGVSGHFPDNAWRDWPKIFHLHNWLDYGHSLLIFLSLVLFWLSEMCQFWGFWAFWSCFVDFPHYGAPLTETDHIWSFWASSGERVGVMSGERGHISEFWLVFPSFILNFNSSKMNTNRWHLSYIQKMFHQVVVNDSWNSWYGSPYGIFIDRQDQKCVSCFWKLL